MIPYLRGNTPFPPPERALSEPDGLLCAGADLGVTRLLSAYRQGIFPWFEDGQPILWWSPDPRCILEPSEAHCSRRLRRIIRSGCFDISFDQAFLEVVRSCAAPRAGSPGTWITPDMISAYHLLHEAGHAHSIEIWQQDRLVGGLYGVALGGAFFGESMFSRCSNASKVAFVVLAAHLQQWGYALFDCQLVNPHLQSLGARAVPRRDFLRILQESLQHTPVHDWAVWSDNNNPFRKP